MDLRRKGVAFEKKYVELDKDVRDEVTRTYHNWQQEGYTQTYKDIPEFCKSVKKQEIFDKNSSLVPSNYIEFVQRDSNVDFGAEMSKLANELHGILEERATLDEQLKAVFSEYGLNL